MSDRHTFLFRENARGTRSGVKPSHSARKGAPRWVPGPLALVFILLGGCCDRDISSIRAPEYERPQILTPTSALTLRIQPVDSVVHDRTRFLVRYHILNTGDRSVTYRDVPEYYYFYIVKPDRHWLAPVANSSILGMGRVDTISLKPGESGPVRTVNLACMDYHPLDFEPRFERNEDQGCMLEYRLRDPGYYAIIGQRVPPGDMPEYDFKGELPSRADTAMIRYEPRSRFPWRRTPLGNRR